MPKKTEVKEANVFSQGLLICPKFYTGWAASTKVDENQMGDLPKEIIKGIKSLLTPKGRENLSDLNSIINEAKGYIGRNSLPFPIPTLNFIPKDRIESVDDRLKEIKERADECFEDLIKTYDDAKADYRANYPDHYQPEKYPTVFRLRAGYRFEWSFRAFTVPDQAMSVLSPRLYKQEMAKFKGEVQEMKDLVIGAVGSELLKKVKSLKEQCSSDSVATSTVSSVHRFLEKFDDMWDGFIAHKELRKMIADVKDYMDGTDASMLKADGAFRKMVEDKMSQITEQLETTNELKRSLDF